MSFFHSIYFFSLLTANHVCMLVSGGSRGGGGGHGAMAPPLNLEGVLSAPEGTLRVPERVICKLQQVLWCPLKGFTDFLRDPLSS